VLPDVPTVADFLPGFEVNAANSIGAPRNTPPEIIDKLN
jgi:tripartite-type tricarboxylate transporter receptor subunit TctC